MESIWFVCCLLLVGSPQAFTAHPAQAVLKLGHFLDKVNGLVHFTLK